MSDTVSFEPSSFLTFVEQGSAPATPASGDQVLYVKTSDHKLYTVNSSGTVTPVSNSIGGGLTDVEAHLGSNVSLGTNSMTDVLSISLTAGTWLLLGKVTITTSVADHFTAELWDGTSHIDSSQFTAFSAWTATLLLFYKVAPGSTTTYKIRATCFNGGATANAAIPQNGVGNNATSLYALKYA